MKGMTLITNPLVNSYKRLVPGYEAPVYIAWSASNRSLAVRVPFAQGAGGRIELRCPDPAANPYLALAVCLEAGLQGIIKKIEPPKSLDCNIFAMSEEEKAVKNIEAVPDSLDEAMEEFLKESERRESAERQVEICKSQIDDQARDIYSLNLRLDSFADMAKRYELLENANEGVRRISEFPDSPQRIARYFETVYPERIAFTERGYLSLKDCITKNDVLWEAFYHMANELYDLLQDDPATAYKTFKEVTGWDCSRGEGTMTRKDAKLMRQYEDIYHGREINIEAHIKSGTKDSDPRSVRIYFAYDPTVAPQLLIGHCGKHLDNYSTRKVK